MKAAVLGTGAWGTALAQVLADNGCNVCMWGVDPSQVEDIRDRRINTAYFKDLHLPANLTATTDIGEAVTDAALMVVAAFGVIPAIVGAILQEAIDVIAITSAIRAHSGSYRERHPKER